MSSATTPSGATSLKVYISKKRGFVETQNVGPCKRPVTQGDTRLAKLQLLAEEIDNMYEKCSFIETATEAYRLKYKAVEHCMPTLRALSSTGLVGTLAMISGWLKVAHVLIDQPTDDVKKELDRVRAVLESTLRSVQSLSLDQTSTTSVNLSEWVVPGPKTKVSWLKHSIEPLQNLLHKDHTLSDLLGQRSAAKEHLKELKSSCRSLAQWRRKDCPQLDWLYELPEQYKTIYVGLHVLKLFHAQYSYAIDGMLGCLRSIWEGGNNTLGTTVEALIRNAIKLIGATEQIAQSVVDTYQIEDLHEESESEANNDKSELSE